MRDTISKVWEELTEFQRVSIGFLGMWMFFFTLFYLIWAYPDQVMNAFMLFLLIVFVAVGTYGPAAFLLKLFRRLFP